MTTCECVLNDGILYPCMYFYALQTIIKGNFFTEREENYVPLEELSKSTLFNSVHKGKQGNIMQFLAVVLVYLCKIVFFASTTWQTGVYAENLYGGNIERVSGLHSYSLGQVVTNLIFNLCCSYTCAYSQMHLVVLKHAQPLPFPFSQFLLMLFCAYLSYLSKQAWNIMSYSKNQLSFTPIFSRFASILFKPNVFLLMKLMKQVQRQPVLLPRCLRKTKSMFVRVCNF